MTATAETEDEYLHRVLSKIIDACPVLPPKGQNDRYNLLDFVVVHPRRPRLEMLRPVKLNLKNEQVLDERDREMLEAVEEERTWRYGEGEVRQMADFVTRTRKLEFLLGLAPGVAGVSVTNVEAGGDFDTLQSRQVQVTLSNIELQRLSTHDNHGGTLLEKMVYKSMQDGKLLSAHSRLGSIYRSKLLNGHSRFIFGVIEAVYWGNLTMEAANTDSREVGGHVEGTIPTGGPVTVGVRPETRVTDGQNQRSNANGSGIVGVNLLCFKVKTKFVPLKNGFAAFFQSRDKQQEVLLSDPIRVFTGDEDLLTEARQWANRYGGTLKRWFRRATFQHKPFRGVLVMVVRDCGQWILSRKDNWFAGDINYYRSDGTVFAAMSDDSSTFSSAAASSAASSFSGTYPSPASTEEPTRKEEHQQEAYFLREQDLFNVQFQSRYVKGGSFIDTVILVEENPKQKHDRSPSSFLESQATKEGSPLQRTAKGERAKYQRSPSLLDPINEESRLSGDSSSTVGMTNDRGTRSSKSQQFSGTFSECMQDEDQASDGSFKTANDVKTRGQDFSPNSSKTSLASSTLEDEVNNIVGEVLFVADSKLLEDDAFDDVLDWRDPSAGKQSECNSWFSLSSFSSFPWELIAPKDRHDRNAYRPLGGEEQEKKLENDTSSSCPIPWCQNKATAIIAAVTAVASAVLLTIYRRDG